MSNIERFIESLGVENTVKVVRFVFGGWDDSIIDYSTNKLEELILNSKPSSPKAITTICYVLGLYAKWLEENNIVLNNNFYREVKAINKKELWKKAKPNASKKFISHSQFESVLHDIENYEDFNSLYYQTLFRCLYEGIYCDDMSVIKNLRGSDIHGTTVTLREDNGNIYDINISAELAEALKELSNNDIWERRNRYNICKVKINGIHSDSCFKVENHKDDSKYTYRFSYYAKLRKISKEYLEYSLLPLQLYVSGIMYRIRLELERNNIDLYEAFSHHNHNRLVTSIISKELIRCRYTVGIGNFREIVKGHLDVFLK